MASSILPILVILSIILGAALNIVLYKILKKNIYAFLVSLLGAPIAGEILKNIVNSLLPKGPYSVGSAIATGLGAALSVLIGIFFFLLASFSISLYRWLKNRKSRQ